MRVLLHTLRGVLRFSAPFFRMIFWNRAFKLDQILRRKEFKKFLGKNY